MVAQNQIIDVKQTKITYTYSAYILHLLHTSWPNNDLELIKAHYTVKGIMAVIRDKNDNQEYVLEIYPK